MVLSLQELSDRMELNDLIVRYSTAVDRRDWDLYETLFTDDATIDYTEAGGIRGDRVTVRNWLAEVMPNFPGFQHMISNSEITLAGDTASGRTMLFNPMVLSKPDGGTHVAFVGLWYNDNFVRTADGWKFSSRYEEVSWMHNWPEDFAVPST
jgi:SnoaL-like domain